ncbi:hypothetical protein G6F50_016375 [Rhizopus delemar]|uniref:Uncharacterized protein n=1 Tax=Rhizopus delemar TaxID=936053 RepID=A0A9P6XTF4_9FUNG|nr:hypothetical protein G6F50_016375 [Rhizopus delemar]
MAPGVMSVQARGGAEVRAGRDSGWDAQQRDDGGISWLALIRGYGGLGVFGAFMGVLAWAVSPSLAAWMAPVVIGMVLASAFSAIVVYAQELVPGKVGMIAGLFFGFAFGMGGVGAAALGKLADATSLEYVYQVCAYLPLLGVVAILLPNVEKPRAGTARG